MGRSPALHTEVAPTLVRLRIRSFTGDQEAVREVLLSPLQIRRAEVFGVLYDLKVEAQGFADAIDCPFTLSTSACSAVIEYMMYDPTFLLQSQFAALRRALGVEGGSTLTIDPGNRQGPFKDSKWTSVQFCLHTIDESTVTVEINSLLKAMWLPVHVEDRQEPCVLSFVKPVNVEDVMQAGFLIQENDPLSPKDDPFFLYEWLACPKNEWPNNVENGFTRCNRIANWSSTYYVRRERLGQAEIRAPT